MPVLGGRNSVSIGNDWQARPLITRTSNYTAAPGDVVLADTSAGAFTVTLPAPTAGRLVTVRKVDTNSSNVVVVAASSGQVDGKVSVNIVEQNGSRDFVADGTNWRILSGYQPASEPTHRPVLALYVAPHGDDNNLGTTPGRPFKTIQAAVNAATHGATIYIGNGTYTETVTLSAKRLRLVGQGPPGVGIGSRIVAPNNTDTIMRLTQNAAGSIIENLGTYCNSDAYTGKAWDLDGCYGGVTIRNCRHEGSGEIDIRQQSRTTGGIGVYIANGEGHVFDGFNVHKARVGFQLGFEASTNTFRNIVTNGCRQTLVTETGGGGSTVLRWKSVNDGAVTDANGELPIAVVDLNDMGDNLYMSCDWTEGISGFVDVRGRNNHFIRCNGAPQSIWRVYGEDHVLDKNLILNGLELYGKRIIVRSPYTGGGYIRDYGDGNTVEGIPGTMTSNRTTRGELDRPRFYASALTVGPAGSAAAPPAAPQRWVPLIDPRSGQVLMVPGYLPVAAAADSFNRADGAVGSADTGQAWSLVTSWGIVGNRLAHTAASANGTATIDAGISDGIVEVDVPVPSTNLHGLLWRYVDADNFWSIQANSVRKTVAGVVTTLGTLPTQAAGDHYRVILDGSKITVERNGRIEVTLTDSALQTATRHGLFSSFDTTARYDGFAVTA